MQTTRTLFIFSIAKRPIKNNKIPIPIIPPTKIVFIPTHRPTNGVKNPAKT